MCPHCHSWTMITYLPSNMRGVWNVIERCEGYRCGWERVVSGSEPASYAGSERRSSGQRVKPKSTEGGEND